VERDTTPGNLWRQAMATSADGSLIITAKFIANGEIFISRDYGATWETKTVSHAGNWRYFASSSSGKRIVAAASSGYIYISEDFGNTWVEQTSAGSRNWIPVAMTGDGSIIVGGAFGGTIWSVTAPATLNVGSISPATGATSGGTTVTISGSGFAAGAIVSIGGNVCASVVVVSSTSITCQTPQGTAGAKSVVVTNTDSESVTSAAGFTYTVPVVNPTPGLAATGSDSATSALVAMMAILVGFGAVSSRRKKARRTGEPAKHRA
jgi:LPXTG-motif cell wall-anchored protein